MPAYVVSVKEVYIQNVVVEADDCLQALQKVGDGEGEELGDAEYTHTLPTEDWGVYPQNDPNKEMRGYEVIDPDDDTGA